MLATTQNFFPGLDCIHFIYHGHKVTHEKVQYISVNYIIFHNLTLKVPLWLVFLVLQIKGFFGGFFLFLPKHTAHVLSHPWLCSLASWNSLLPVTVFCKPDIILDPIQSSNHSFFAQYLVTNWSLSCLFITLFIVFLSPADHKPSGNRAFSCLLQNPSA